MASEISNGRTGPWLDDWDTAMGEDVPIAEAIVVAPIGGRLHRGPIPDGAPVESGAELGRIDAPNGGGSSPITSRLDGVFLGWLAWEDESVVPGTMLARIRRNGTAGNGSAGRNGHAPADEEGT